MTQPRLLILSFSDISSDARVLKQVTLFADQYDVTTYGYGPQPDPRVRHLRLDDSQGIRRWSRTDVLLRRYQKMYWEQAAVSAALAALEGLDRFDAVIANDIDTVGLALALQPRHGVHVDIHEYAPKQNEELLMWRLFDAPFVTWMCRTFLPQAASMTTVGGGLAREYKRVFNLDADIVTNATPYTDLAPTEVTTPIRLVHSGAGLRNRRLEVFIDAVIATTSDVTLDLYLMANHPSYIEELRQRASVSDRIRVLPGLPYQELVTGLNQYDVGLAVLAPTNFNLAWCLPNKFFDYVQARLGLIIGPSPEMSQILTERGLGEVSKDFSSSALTAALNNLTLDQVRSWKENAHLAAHDLAAETQIKTWDRAIRDLLLD